jgi:DNA-binding MarR family transcriptional regulator
MPDQGSHAPYPAQLLALSEFRFRLRQFLGFSESASERVGIQAQQYQLMQVIAGAPDGEQTSIGYIAERMALRHNSTVELVDRAEKAELVARHSDSRDLRRSIVRLTPKGDVIFRTLLDEHIAEVKRVSGDLVDSLQMIRDADPA